MPKKTFDNLTEPMFYVLLCFYQQDMCGAEIAARVTELTAGRVCIGPGTLYTLLGSFQKNDLIHETGRTGRRITYAITEKGRQIYLNEIFRLEQCLRDARCVKWDGSF